MTSGIVEAFEAWFACRTANDPNSTAEKRDGATAEEISVVEELMGFRLTDDLRELYLHCNGIDNDHFVPPLVHQFRTIQSGVEARQGWLAGVHSMDEVGDLPDQKLRSLPGAPSQPFLVFEGLLGIAVECGPIGTGAVMYQGEEADNFFWVARSLAEYFQRLVDQQEDETTPPIIDSYGNFNGVYPPCEPEFENSYDPNWGYWRWEN